MCTLCPILYIMCVGTIYMQDVMECTLVFTVSKHLACSLANCLYCNVLPFTKNAIVPSAAVCQLTSADHGIASQWTTLARLLGLSRSQMDVVRLECLNRPQLCQQSAAKVLSLWSTRGGTARSCSLATLLRACKHMDQLQNLQRSSMS